MDGLRVLLERQSLMLDRFLARIKEALFPGSEVIALPMMDGALKPNRRLDEAQPLGDALPGCDDVIALPDGTLLVSAGTQIVQLTGSNLDQQKIWFQCPGVAGPLAVSGTRVYVGIAGLGVLRIENGRMTARLESAQGQALHCATALAVLPDGSIAIAEGSTANGPADWTRDLLEQRAQGRVLIASPDFASVRTLASHLAWPAGLRVQDQELWVSESWRHRVQALPLTGAAPRAVVQNLPGYPGRLVSDPSGNVWLAMFALRTQLLEFVLREHAYRKEMLATVDPRYWIAPSLAATGHYLEPLQGGAIKKLGIVKPWAPPRSYGLVLRLSAQGEILESLHSRTGGTHHGITAVLRRDQRLVAISKGSGRVLACDLS